MGYTTEFTGRFNLDKPLDDETYNYLIKFNETRRMARKLDPKYGVEGEFYVEGSGDFGQGEEDNIIDFNKPPSTQPSLWCKWRPSEDRLGIEWDGNEKFYEYREWLAYINKNFLIPKGYVLTGSIKYQGEDPEDAGEFSVASVMNESEIPVAAPPPVIEMETLKPRRILLD